MSGCELDEPEDVEYCEAVTIGRNGRRAEVTIFYTPDEGQARLFPAFHLAVSVWMEKWLRRLHFFRIPSSQWVPSRDEISEESWQRLSPTKNSYSKRKENLCSPISRRRRYLSTPVHQFLTIHEKRYVIYNLYYVCRVRHSNIRILVETRRCKTVNLGKLLHKQLKHASNQSRKCSLSDWNITLMSKRKKFSVVLNFTDLDFWDEEEMLAKESL